MIKQFIDCPQDSQWHSEGNVYIHTEMVLNTLYELFDGEASHLNDHQRMILTYAALLHDIGKPFCTASF